MSLYKQKKFIQKEHNNLLSVRIYYALFALFTIPQIYSMNSEKKETPLLKTTFKTKQKKEAQEYLLSLCNYYGSDEKKVFDFLNELIDKENKIIEELISFKNGTKYKPSDGETTQDVKLFIQNIDTIINTHENKLSILTIAKNHLPGI